MTPNEKQITQLYVGYFGRAADRDGFNFWLAQANAGAAIVDIAYSFWLGSECQDTYGGLPNGELVDKIYLNLFDRTPDAAGKTYWLNELANGKPVARLLVDIVSGAQGNDRIILENAAIVAKNWTDRSPAAFVMADAQNAIASINEVQPVTGNGLTVNIIDTALLPWQNQIDASMKAAWGQWELHFDNTSQMQIDVGYFPIPDSGKIASAAPHMEVATASGYMQSGVAQEIITGMDPNGRMADGFINIHWDVNTVFNIFDMTAVFAHEIGHFFYRTQLLNTNAEAMTNYDSFISASGGTLHFDGPNAMQAYGGPVPIPRTGSFNDFAHFDDGNLLMYPYYSGSWVVGVVDLAVLRDIGVMTI